MRGITIDDRQRSIVVAITHPAGSGKRNAASRDRGECRPENGEIKQKSR
jgi:hypothetical protein